MIVIGTKRYLRPRNSGLSDDLIVVRIKPVLRRVLPSFVEVSTARAETIFSRACDRAIIAITTSTAHRRADDRLIAITRIARVPFAAASRSILSRASSNHPDYGRSLLHRRDHRRNEIGGCLNKERDESVARLAHVQF